MTMQRKIDATESTIFAMCGDLLSVGSSSVAASAFSSALAMMLVATDAMIEKMTTSPNKMKTIPTN
jgi:hypothetical protein